MSSETSDYNSEELSSGVTEEIPEKEEDEEVEEEFGAEDYGAYGNSQQTSQTNITPEEKREYIRQKRARERKLTEVQSKCHSPPDQDVCFRFTSILFTAGIAAMGIVLMTIAQDDTNGLFDRDPSGGFTDERLLNGLVAASILAVVVGVVGALGILNGIRAFVFAFIVGAVALFCLLGSVGSAAVWAEQNQERRISVAWEKEYMAGDYENIERVQKQFDCCGWKRNMTWAPNCAVPASCMEPLLEHSSDVLDEVALACLVSSICTLVACVIVFIYGKLEGLFKLRPAIKVKTQIGA